ncbi:MAG: FecR domain-containing protein [Magnetococcales bacterium]|nr:FecR domain-containing protein [Magnetococcales bacterium]
MITRPLSNDWPTAATVPPPDIDAARSDAILSDSGLETEIILADVATLLDGRYSRQGDDLVITAPSGQPVIVEGYFTFLQPPVLRAPNGALLMPETVSSLLVAPSPPASTLVAGPTMVGPEGGASAATPESPATTAAAADSSSAVPLAIGKVGQLLGAVLVKGADGVERPLKEGDLVFKGDVLQTKKGGLVKLTFGDGTTFQLGEGAQAILDKFIYNPEAKQGGFEATVTRGIFSFQSGAISGLNAGRHSTIKTPTAVIGIRGSELSGEVGDDGSTTVVHTSGILDISDAKGQGTVTLIEPNTATQVQFGAGAPTPVFKAPDAFLNRLNGQLDIDKAREERGNENNQENQGTNETQSSDRPQGNASDAAPETPAGDAAPREQTEAQGDEGVDDDPADPQDAANEPEGVEDVPDAPGESPTAQNSTQPGTDPTTSFTGLADLGNLADLLGAGGTFEGETIATEAIGDLPLTASGNDPLDLAGLLGGTEFTASPEPVPEPFIPASTSPANDLGTILDPTPDTEPEPEPTPEPGQQPEPEPTPEPVPEPTPEPVPEPVPEPTPLPEPVPEPIPEPVPEPPPVTPPVYTPPAQTRWQVAAIEDTRHVFSPLELGLDDIDLEHLTRIRILSGVASGQLLLDGQTVAIGDEIAIDRIQAGSFAYQPGDNRHGENDDTFSFQIRVAGETDVRATGYSVWLDVRPVNDLPTGGDQAVEVIGSRTFAIGDFGFSDPDGDAMISVRIVALPETGHLLLDGQAVAVGTEVSATDIATGKLLYAATVTDTTVHVGFLVNDGTDHATTANTLSLAIPHVNHGPTGSIMISGTAVTGATVTVVNSLSDADGLGAMAYQWWRGETAIAGATGDSLVLTDDLAGHELSVRARYTDGHGTEEEATSPDFGPVVHLNRSPTGSVVINGIATMGETLSATHSLTDADGLGTVHYQWQADGLDLEGATQDTLLLTSAHLGHVIRVIASFTDAWGTLERAPSGPTNPVSEPDRLAVDAPPEIVAPLPIHHTDSPAPDRFIPVTGALTATDPEGEPLTYGISGGENGLFILDSRNYTVMKEGTLGTLYLNGQTGAYVHVPGDLNPMVHDVSESFTLTVSDGSLDATTLLVIDLAAANDHPVIVPPGVIGYSDTLGTDLFANTTGTLTASDPEGAPLTFGIVDGEHHVAHIDGLPYDTRKTGTYGNLHLDSTTGAYVHVPGAINGIATSTSEPFVLTVSDGHETRTTPLVINITAIDNDAPILGSLAAIELVDTPATDTFVSISGVLVGTDAEGSPLRYGIQGGIDASTTIDGLTFDRLMVGTLGRLHLDSVLGTYLLIPDEEAINGLTTTASEQFFMTVFDGDKSGATALDLIVLASNDLPTIGSNLGITFASGATVAISPSHLGALDKDSPTTALLYTLTSTPTHGNLTLDGNLLAIGDHFTQAQIDQNRLGYTHSGILDPNMIDNDDLFTFTVQDEESAVTGQEFLLHYNLPPTLETNAGVTLFDGGHAVISASRLLVVDSDTPADALVYTLSTTPTHGTLTKGGIILTPSGTFTQEDIDDGILWYNHSADGSTEDHFTFSVSDGDNDLNIETFALNIEPAASLAGVHHATVAGEVFLGGDYIELGISSLGSFGTGGSKPLGFYGTTADNRIGMTFDHDGFNQGLDAAIDFFLPGTPEERWTVGYYDDSVPHIGTNSLLQWDSDIAITAITDTSSGSTLSAVIDGTFNDVLQIQQSICFSVDALFFRNVVTLTNLGDTTLDSVRYMRSFDPDNTEYLNGSFTTINTIVHQQADKSMVQALSLPNDNYHELTETQAAVLYYSDDARAQVAAFPYSYSGPVTAGYGNDGFTIINLFDPGVYESAPVAGTIHTADQGISITFDVGSLVPGASATFSYYTSLDNRDSGSVLASIAQWGGDPLVLDLDGLGIELTSMIDDPHLFDMNADGTPDRTGWVGGKDGLLVLDRNGNGTIDDIREVFSEYFAPGSQGSLASLATLDDNGDQRIDANDMGFYDLKVWTADGTLSRLDAHGITALDLDPVANPSVSDLSGNTLSALAGFARDDGTTGTMAEVHFSYRSGATTASPPHDATTETNALAPPETIQDPVEAFAQELIGLMEMYTTNDGSPPPGIVLLPDHGVWESLTMEPTATLESNAHPWALMESLDTSRLAVDPSPEHHGLPMVDVLDFSVPING